MTATQLPLPTKRKRTRSATYCEYGDHDMVAFSGCLYSDEPNGIPEMHVCLYHYAQHILKYYPDSREAGHIRDDPNDYLPEATP